MSKAFQGSENEFSGWEIGLGAWCILSNLFRVIVGLLSGWRMCVIGCCCKYGRWAKNISWWLNAINIFIFSRIFVFVIRQFIDLIRDEIETVWFYILSSQLIRPSFPTKYLKGGAHSTMWIVTVSSISIPHIARVGQQYSKWMWKRNGTNRNMSKDCALPWYRYRPRITALPLRFLHHRFCTLRVIRERLSVCFTDGQRHYLHQKTAT